MRNCVSIVRSHHPLRVGLIFYETKGGICRWLGAARRVSGVSYVDYMVGRVSLWAGIVAPSPIFSITSIVNGVVVSLVSVHVGLVHWLLREIKSKKHA